MAVSKFITGAKVRYTDHFAIAGFNKHGLKPDRLYTVAGYSAKNSSYLLLEGELGVFKQDAFVLAGDALPWQTTVDWQSNCQATDMSERFTVIGGEGVLTEDSRLGGIVLAENMTLTEAKKFIDTVLGYETVRLVKEHKTYKIVTKFEEI